MHVYSSSLLIQTQGLQYWKSQSSVCFKIWLCKGVIDGDKPEVEGNLSESNHETTELLFWGKKGVKGAEKSNELQKADINEPGKQVNVCLRGR